MSGECPLDLEYLIVRVRYFGVYLLTIGNESWFWFCEGEREHPITNVFHCFRGKECEPLCEVASERGPGCPCQWPEPLRTPDQTVTRLGVQTAPGCVSVVFLGAAAGGGG